MASKTLSIKTPKTGAAYNITVGHELLSGIGEWTARTVGPTTKHVAVISNAKVFGLYGKEVTRSLERSGFAVHTWLMKDGERHKSLRSLEESLKFLSRSGITRSDAVIALGGGVVGDLAGFAASIYLRGIPFLQVPTTLLSMIDSSVGGKTGINTEFGKNLVGSFYQPRGVLVDVQTLVSLPAREMTAGLCEAIKQGALSGRKLFDQTSDLVESYPKGRRNAVSEPNLQTGLIELVSAQISFKARIVAQDEREEPDRRDARSRKILNFGHTFGHALEKVTNYQHFKHGEAVGYGIIFAANLSKILELGDENELKCLNDVVHRAGNLPPLQGIDPNKVFEAFQFDKKKLAESLQWILLRKIGQPIILSGKDVPKTAVKKALRQFLPGKSFQ